MPALLVDRNRNSTSRRDQYRKVGLQEAIPRLASIVDELRANRRQSNYFSFADNPGVERLVRPVGRPRNLAGLLQPRPESYKICTLRTVGHGRTDHCV